MAAKELKLSPYSVPAVDRHGRPFLVQVLASEQGMLELAQAGPLVLRAEGAQPVRTALEQAALVCAVHERDSFLAEGGVLS